MRFGSVTSLVRLRSEIHTRGMPIRMMLSIIAAFALSACGSASDSGGHQAASHTAEGIDLGSPRGATFYPRDPPDGAMSPQDAYNALLHSIHRPPKPIPAGITARYGLLNQSDTHPPAYRMPVWAFTTPKGPCETGIPVDHPGNCVHWDFARASDGKYLQVVDQQPVP